MNREEGGDVIVEGGEKERIRRGKWIDRKKNVIYMIDGGQRVEDERKRKGKMERRTKRSIKGRTGGVNEGKDGRKKGGKREEREHGRKRWLGKEGNAQTEGGKEEIEGRTKK